MGGLVDMVFGGGSKPQAPDYGPVAQASKESAEIAAQLGREQLAEGRRQYDQNMEVAAPIVAKQGAIMDQTIQQGQELYDYMKSRQRPVEDALNAESMKAGSEQLQQEAADRAVADVRQGTTAAQNQLIRQGLRYGWTPAKLAATGMGLATEQGLAEVTAANAARTQERNIGFAKKMDVAGLYRGLPGASQGAYGVATNAGNSAVSNQMAPGSALTAAMGQSNATTMQGRQIALTGLSGILNNQTSAFNVGQSEFTKQRGQNMNVIGTVAGMFK